MSPHLRFKQVLDYNSSVPPSTKAHVHLMVQREFSASQDIPTVLIAPGLLQV